MSERIDRTAAPVRTVTETPDGPQEGAAGSWRGEAVRIAAPDIASLLDNAKEELSFAHSSRMERKSIQERRITRAERGQQAERQEQLEERQVHLDEYTGRLPDFDQRRYASMLEDLRKSGEGMEGILRRARERFPDPSHAFAALDLAQNRFREEGDGERARLLAAARDRLAEENGEAIRAGLNVSVAAFEFAEGNREAAADLRERYRETVFSEPGPSGLYRGIIAKFGAEGFPSHIRFLSRAVGDDLGAAGPSVEPARLHELVRDLSALRVLDTVHERCAQLAERVARQAGAVVTVTEIMRQLLPLTEEVVAGPSKLIGLPAQVGIPEDRIEAQIAFLREAREIVAMLPPGLFRDVDARFAVLRAAQEALDVLIEREEG
jgi:type III secretion protein W